MENEMKKLVEKEKELIKKPIIHFLEEKLSDEFSNNKGQLIIRIRDIYVFVSVNEDESSFKEKIIITRVDGQANVTVDIGYEATSNNTLILRTNKGFTLIYDNEAKEYCLENVDEVTVIDVTPI